jgi:tetratricopeptide (TPR) repeat protein
MAIAKQVVEWMREICRQDSGDDAKSRLFWSLLSLGTFESEFKHQKQARACFEETFQIARQLRDQSGGAESLRYVLVSLWELGNIEMQEGKEEAIKSNFVEYFLGDIKVAEGNLAAAKVFLEEGLQIARDLREQLGTPQSLKDVCVSLGILGYIKVAEGNLATSRALFEERLQIARDLHEQLGTPQSLENVSFSLKGIGDIEIAELNFAAARAFFEEHLQIRRELYRQRGTPKNLDYLICSLSDFASIANNNEGIPFAHEAMEKSRMLYEGFPQYPRQSLELMTLLYEVAIR